MRTIPSLSDVKEVRYHPEGAIISPKTSNYATQPEIMTKFAAKRLDEERLISLSEVKIERYTINKLLYYEPQPNGTKIYGFRQYDYASDEDTW